MHAVEMSGNDKEQFFLVDDDENNIRRCHHIPSHSAVASKSVMLLKNVDL